MPKDKAMQLVAACLTDAQAAVCGQSGVTVMHGYACSWGEVVPGCVTDFSVHCYNADTYTLLAEMGIARATLHPELNLAQIRDMLKILEAKARGGNIPAPIAAEAIVYGKLPLMCLAVPPAGGAYITDRTGARFFVHRHTQGATLYNSVPIFTADKLTEIEKTGITHARLIFTDESPDEVRAVIRAYETRQAPEGLSPRGGYTRGKHR